MLDCKYPMVVDYKGNICELLRIQVGNPFKHRDLISLVLVYHRMCLSPFSKSISIYEIDLIAVVETSGKGMDELCIFFLEYRVIRIWGFDLLVPDLCRKIICTGIDDIHRSVLSLVAAVHNNTEGYAQALVKDRLEKTVEP